MRADRRGCVESFGHTMAAPRKHRIAKVLGLGSVLLILGLLVTSWPRGTLVIRHVRPSNAGSTARTAEFALSNGTSRFIGGRADVPQFFTNGGWAEWPEPLPYGAVFYLRPGETTNLAVTLPQSSAARRVPFLWGNAEAPAIAPRLRLRIDNLLFTLKTSGSWRGWLDDQGSLSCRTNVCDVD